MHQATHQIESNIEKSRNELGANLSELEHRVKQLDDWRHHYSLHPLLLVGAAFGGGILLASMLGGRTTHHTRWAPPSRGLNGNAEGLAERIPVVVFSVSSDEVYSQRALTLGARG